jgi:hypothetical protein
MNYFPKNSETTAKLQEIITFLNEYLEWFIDVNDDSQFMLDDPKRFKIHAHLALNEALNLWLDSVDWRATFINYRESLEARKPFVGLDETDW